MSLKTFTQQYLATALWSSNDESREDGGDPMDRNYNVEDIAPESRAKLEADCAAFYTAQSHLLLDDNFTGRYDHDIDGRAGHDFWLTQNHHGAGFWDGSWHEPAATILTDASHAFGERDLYIGDDEQVHAS